MKNFYLNSIYGKKRKYPEIYKTLQREVFGRELTWKEIQEQEKDKLITIMCELESRIRLHESPIDVEKMAMAIQRSRSGGGFCAITEYTCYFCGTEESWGNTAVPNICRACARKMAEYIAKYMPDIYKDEVKASLEIDVLKLKGDIETLLADDSQKANKETEKERMYAGSKPALELLKQRLENGEYYRN